MKVQIMSDLHVDFPGSLGVPPLVPGTDLVIVAGDTCQGLVKSVETVRHAYPPPTEIVMVAGNHEFWSKRLCYREHLEEGRLAAALHGVRFLENDVQTVGNVRLLGCTLYYMLFGETLLGAAMRSAADTMNDHRRIKGSRNPWLRFRPAEARVLHLRSRAFLERETREAASRADDLHFAITLLRSMRPRRPTGAAFSPPLTPRKCCP
jgi:hypothetical protein